MAHFVEHKDVDSKVYKYQTAIMRDLLLLGNQVPLIVLKVLLNLKFQNGGDQKEFIWNFLKKSTLLPRTPKGKPRTDASMDSDFDTGPHHLHLMWEHFALPNQYLTKPISRIIGQPWHVFIMLEHEKEYQ